jgi:ribosomal protein S18 acetylase RimI-like enzyme
MQFELSEALVDEILFFMEDQNGEFLLDTQEGIVLSTEDEELDFDADNDRYIPLPDWGPSDGFRLMERFTAGLHNALIREELSAALDRGRGVFRAFKNTLTQYPEAEKLWFSYKDREMKNEVISWYNSLRESWGLELIGEEPEDLVGLVLEDFRFRDGTAQDRAQAEELHNMESHIGESHDAESHSGDGISMGEWVFPGDLCFVTETAGGEFAGYINAVREGTQGSDASQDSEPVLRVCTVEVQTEYRGLGLGKALLTRLLEHADSEKISRVSIDLPAGQEHFSRALLRENFKLSVQRYYRTHKE